MIRIGIIGAGPNAAGHAQYYHQSPRTRLVGIADIDQARAQTLAAESEARAVTDYRDFLDEVDAVVISSPNFLHKEQVVFCANAGKHVYCEKPMGLSQGDAMEIADAVANARIQSQIGFAVRFDPAVQTMQRFQQEGRFGSLVSLCSRRLFYMEPEKPSHWRSDHRLSGGILLEVNIHELDWMMALGGELRSVYARTWAQNENVPRGNDHLWVTLNFAQGAVGQHEGSWRSPNAQFYRSVSGANAGLSTDEWGGTLYFAENGKSRETIDADSAFDIRGNFLDSIDGVAAPVADAAWGLKVMSAAEAIFESAASGQVVTIAQEKQP